MPRVEELIIITECSPWCTIIKNPQGVTLGDVVTMLFKECAYNPQLYGVDLMLTSLVLAQLL